MVLQILGTTLISAANLGQIYVLIHSVLFLEEFELHPFYGRSSHTVYTSCSVGSFQNSLLCTTYIYIHTHREFSYHPLSCTLGICSGFREALQQPATATLLQQLTELTALQIERKHESLSVPVFSTKPQYQGYESKGS